MTADEMFRKLGYERCGDLQMRKYSRVTESGHDIIWVNAKNGAEKLSIQDGCDCPDYWWSVAEIRTAAKLLKEMGRSDEANRE